MSMSATNGGTRGFTVFFTGFSGAGKSTLATLLSARLGARGRPDVTLLDGDAIRKCLSPELGFTKQDRDLHIRRIGSVAQAITAKGGVAICAPIAPFDEARRAVRSMVADVGAFVLVHVSTPLAICEQRDPKGLYARARAGAVSHFTGVSDPYETPADADIDVDTSRMSAEDAVDTILTWLEEKGLVTPAIGV